MRVTSTFLTVSVLAAALLVAVGASAGLVTYRYDFPEPSITRVDGYDRILMEGAHNFGEPGDPVLPRAGARLLLPPGEIVSEVVIVPGERVELGHGYLIEPGQQPRPLSHRGPFKVMEADYAPGTTYPDALHGGPVFGLFRGYGIVNLPLSPVEYDVDTGSIYYYRSLDVEVRTEPDPAAARSLSLRIAHDDRTVARLAGMVDNPQASAQYSGIDRQRSGRSLDPSLGYNYIIITTDAWDDYLGDFVDFRTRRGQKVGVFLKSWIVSNYTGEDDQDSIRNFIIDAYNTWTCDYVLLVGDGEPSDTDGIPARGFYATAGMESDTNVAADLYYAALDGSWNADEDSRWGEDGEEDFYPEVAVGRVCATFYGNVESFVTKTMRYLDEPVVSECDEALMVGELLWEDPDIWGGAYKDEVAAGGTYNGYTTTGFPTSMNISTLYERDYPGNDWPKSALISQMESGTNIVNHMGHCNTYWLMKMVVSDLASFDNDGTIHSLNFVYSQGCYAGSFDNRQSDLSYGADCMAEEFAGDDDGAVALVANSRYGWGDTEGTNGASQYYDREFFDAIFAEGIYPIGDVNNDSKVDALWAIGFGANKWCYYQLNVFGDPAMQLWTAEPVAMSISAPDTIMVGQPDMDITVTDVTRSPVEGAVVTIYNADYSVYDTGVTDAAGFVVLHPDAPDTGTLYVTATAHDRLAAETSAVIEPMSGVLLALDSHVIDDDQLGDSSGNGDGEAGAGETIELVVTVGNHGADAATDVVATLSTTSGRISLLDSFETFGTIPGGGSAQCLDDFDFEISSDTPDGEVISFTLTMSDGRGTWESFFDVTVHAPVLSYLDHVDDDPLYLGNGNGCPDAGETISISVDLSNSGSAPATGVVAVLSSADPYVILGDDTGSVALMNPSETATLAPGFTATLMPDTPVDHEIVFDLSVSGDWGYASSGQFSVSTAGNSLVDDVESGEGGWTHGTVSMGFVDDWHIETSRYHSSDHSWKAGGAGTADYSSSHDGALTSKTVCLGANGAMTFWHRMNAEEDSWPLAWDCGLVEITTDGGDTWSTLYPDGGYSHQKNDNLANPLPPGTPCWSGTFDWRQETFDLSAFEGERVRVRFRFCSDGYVEEEGWYVDDVDISSDATTGVEAEDALPRRLALGQNSPNPFNPVTVIHYQLPSHAHVRIEVFNIAGRRVRTLVNGEEDAGYRSVVWDGTDDGGARVASGVYLYRMEAGDFTAKKMMVLLK
jgi:hypothetical protein